MPFSQRAPDTQNCYKPAVISNDTSLTLKIPLVARMVFQNLAMKDGTCAAAVRWRWLLKGTFRYVSIVTGAKIAISTPKNASNGASPHAD
jgi:hypothetical protein